LPILELAINFTKAPLFEQVLAIVRATFRQFAHNAKLGKRFAVGRGHELNMLPLLEKPMG